MRPFLLTILLVGIVRASPGEEPEEVLKVNLNNRCSTRKEASSCIASELITHIERMLKFTAIHLSDDIVLVDESDGKAAEMPSNSLYGRSDATLEEQAQLLITEKLTNFMKSRSMRVHILDNVDLVIAGMQDLDSGSWTVGSSLKPHKYIAESGRARQKNYGPILAAVATKFGLIGALTFKALALMVGKALLISKIALLLSTIIGLKKLFASQKKDVKYEIFTRNDWNHWGKSADSYIAPENNEVNYYK